MLIAWALCRKANVSTQNGPCMSCAMCRYFCVFPQTCISKQHLTLTSRYSCDRKLSAHKALRKCQHAKGGRVKNYSCFNFFLIMSFWVTG